MICASTGLSRPAAVVFDMDGLLFDTETLSQAAFVAAASETGQQFPSDLFFRLIGGTWPDDRTLLLDHCGASFPVDAFQVIWKRQFDLLVETSLTLKPGALALLGTLDELRIPRAIATSSSLDSVRHHLGALGLTGRFDAIVARGDYAAGKPAPDPYLRAAERLGVEPRLCLALEDSFNGIRSAAAAGMIAVMVPDLLQPTPEIRALCSFIADDLLAVRQSIIPCKGGEVLL